MLDRGAEICWWYRSRPAQQRSQVGLRAGRAGQVPRGLRLDAHADAEAADLVLPLRTFAEKEGFVAGNGVQRLQRR
jgi:hypothetical protein